MIRKNRFFLYRGMDKEMYKSTKGKLIPFGTVDIAALCPSENLFPSEKLFPGTHQANAVDKHQNPLRYNEDNFKKNSAYLSTTPNLERAKYYATRGNTLSGYVFKIDREILAQYEIEEFIVAEIATSITMPEDDEVLLKPFPSGSVLHERVIVEVLEVEPTR